MPSDEELIRSLRQMRRVLTVPEVAELLQTSPRTVYRDCRRNRIPYIRYNGDRSAIRIMPGQLATWLESKMPKISGC